MRILIAAAGSRGDVAPYTGLGNALLRAGHEVALAAPDAFAPLAREAGLEFRGLPARAEGGGAATKRELMRTAAAFVTELGRGFAAAMDRGTDLLLLSTTTAPLGWHLAEATGTPAIGAYLVPAAPTGDFPPVVTAARSLGRPGNRTAGRFALRMADRLYTGAVADLRRSLGLPRSRRVRCAADRSGRTGPFCTASARHWCRAPPTGGRGWRSWAPGGRTSTRPGG